jgi:PAS domain S-box-containing protein
MGETLCRTTGGPVGPGAGGDPWGSSRSELAYGREERYRELFDDANDIVYTHDLEGHYTSLNKKGQQITGYTCEEAATLEFTNLATREDVALARKMLRRKLAGDETSTIYEISILAKDGTVIAVEVNTQLIFENGKPIGVQGIARDIRARKEAEEKFRQVSQSLLEAERRAITEYKTLLERIAQLAQVLASARDLAPNSSKPYLNSQPSRYRERTRHCLIRS